MKNHEALELIAYVLNSRCALNKAELAGINAALQKLKEATVESDPIGEILADDRKDKK